MPSRDVQRALPQQPTDTLRLYAVGDINLGRRLAKERLLEGDTLYPLLAVRDSLAAADITLGNLESPIPAESSAAPDSGAESTGPPAAVVALARGGCRIGSTGDQQDGDHSR